MEGLLEILSYMGLNPDRYSIAIDIYTRLMGILYLVVYVPFLYQIKGLYGEKGLRPIGLFLDNVYKRFGRKSYYLVPSVWWFCSKEWALYGLVWAGIFFGGLLSLGVWPPVMLLLLFIIHLSLVSAGQDFMSFGWETLLLEFTIASVLLTATVPYNVLGWLTLNFIFVRFMLQAGASKLLTRDKTWRDLTATAYHYLTQPIPNMQAWYAHKLPMWFQKGSTLVMFWVELVVPLLVFSPESVRLFCFFNFFGLFFVIWQTGNFSYLNFMCAIFSVLFIGNRFLEPFIGVPAQGVETGWIWYGIVSVLALGLLFLQVINLWNYFFKEQWIGKVLGKVQPFHISQPHQLFSMMTTQRHEVVIEGSYDKQNWKEYLFYYKVSDVARRPVRIAPYQPRLDWQAWFLPLRNFQSQYWFHTMIQKLLEGEPSVTQLLRYNPFAEAPPKYVRVLLYDYEFTTWEERKRTGNWWKRRLIGEYAPCMELTKKSG